MDEQSESQLAKTLNGPIYNEIKDWYYNNHNPYTHFLTITLPPKLLKYQPITQWEMTNLVINTIFVKYCQESYISTELTLAGNIHYHAIVIARDKCSLVQLMNAFKKKFEIGFCKLTPQVILPENAQRTILYLIKDLDETKKILHTSNYKPQILFKPQSF